MMDLKGIDLLSLQSQYMSGDMTTQALCKSLNPFIQQIASKLDECNIYSRIDELDANALDELSWQFDVAFYDMELSIEKKRTLIKNAIRWHRLKGTPQAIIESATSVFGRTKLKEWFEYGGNPYFFKLQIDITEQGASMENLNKLDTLINKYKNKRSWLEKMEISLANKGNVYFSCSTICGEEIAVYPWSIKEVSSKGDINIGVGSNVDIESISIYPKGEMS